MNVCGSTYRFVCLSRGNHNANQYFWVLPMSHSIIRLLLLTHKCCGELAPPFILGQKRTNPNPEQIDTTHHSDELLLSHFRTPVVSPPLGRWNDRGYQLSRIDALVARCVLIWLINHPKILHHRKSRVYVSRVNFVSTYHRNVIDIAYAYRVWIWHLHNAYKYPVWLRM